MSIRYECEMHLPQICYIFIISLIPNGLNTSNHNNNFIINSCLSFNSKLFVLAEQSVLILWTSCPKLQLNNDKTKGIIHYVI